MTKTPLIWLTRPKDDSVSVAAQLAERGIQTIIAPVVHIVPLPLSQLPQMPDALLLTSRHGAHALASLPSAWRALPVYCVGASTAMAATEHGCSQVIAGTSNILALLPRVAADLGEGGALLYLSGEDVSVDAAHLLGAQGVRVHTEIVYRAVAEPTLENNVQETLTAGSITGVAFFSPRSAEIACEQLNVAKLAHVTQTIDAFCFSLNVATAAAKLPWKNIHACHLPTRDAMLELIVSHATKTL